MRGLVRGLAAAGCALLTGCALPFPTVTTVHFVAGPSGGEIDPRTLLARQVVPADRLLTMREALDRAPEGALLLTCWKDTDLSNFWGPCSHVARKMGRGQVAEQMNSRAPAGLYPDTRAFERSAVIVLDVGVRPEHLNALEAEVKRRSGERYSFSGSPDTSYCSSYQNELQRAMGLPDVIPLNTGWTGYLPEDALYQPGVRVLWVGLNEGR